MAGPHCAVCAQYEERVMGKAEGEVLPPDVKPCGSFQMSDRFRDWAVGEMRKEVLGQVKAAGLDRMAMVKAKGKTNETNGTAAGKGNPPKPPSAA